MEEWTHPPGFGAWPGEHNPVGRLAPVTGKQFPGDRLEMPLLFFPDPVVVVVLAPAGSVLIPPEPSSSRGVGPEAGKLGRVGSGDLEKARAGPVEDNRENTTELVFHGGELSDERRTVHRQAGTVDQRHRGQPE